MKAAKQLTAPAPRVSLIVALYRPVEEFEVAHAALSSMHPSLLTKIPDTLGMSRQISPSTIFFSLSESDLVIAWWWRRQRHVHAVHVAVELARVTIFELDAIGDDLEVLARRCDLDVRDRQQLILAFERFIDGARRLFATGHLSPPFLGEDARPARMFETNPLAMALVAGLVADF